MGMKMMTHKVQNFYTQTFSLPWRGNTDSCHPPPSLGVWSGHRILYVFLFRDYKMRFFYNFLFWQVGELVTSSKVHGYVKKRFGGHTCMYPVIPSVCELCEFPTWSAAAGELEATEPPLAPGLEEGEGHWQDPQPPPSPSDAPSPSHCNSEPQQRTSKQATSIEQHPSNKKQ